MRPIILLLFLVTAMLVCLVSAEAAVPPIISYQGKLMQPIGIPTPDGVYSVRFAIYDAPTAGNMLWSEVNPAVQVKSGLFAVLLGSMNNLGPNILDSESRYLGIMVGNDAELSPRQQITSVATALRAGEADVAKTVLDGAVTSRKIADGAVTAAKLHDGVVVENKIADQSVTTSKLADRSVNVDKLAFEEWKTWEPTYSAYGDMTFTDVTTVSAKYIRLGRTIFFQLWFAGTTGGTPSMAIRATLPAKASAMFGGGCAVSDGAGHGGGAYNTTNDLMTLDIKLSDIRNYTLGAYRGAFISGVYEAQ